MARTERRGRETRFRASSAPARLRRAALAALVCLPWAAGLAAPALADRACPEDGRTLEVGFYAFFQPVSHSADPDPEAAGFHTHRGYEADLLTALEAMDGAGLSFSRQAIAAWDDIWLLSAGPDYDLVGGGITILDSRTSDASGERRVAFTAGHIEFRQSLLVRAADAQRFASYEALTGDVRVGALAGTTGEARLLRLTGLADADGVLVAGARIVTPAGDIVTDGGPDFVIAANGASPGLEGRLAIHPPTDAMPQVVHLGGEAGEAELLEALREGVIDAVARGEIGNREAAHRSGGAFAVAALDERVEHGGFTVAAEREDLLSCLDEKIDWLTDGRRIGYAAWLTDPSVFLDRAMLGNEAEDDS